MAAGRDRAVLAADLALVERQVSEWEDSCAVVWGEWLAAVMVAQITLSQTRVSWH